MSVVGPRPALPNEVAAYNDYQRQRLLVKPGMTCYWQTRRNRDSVTFDEWVDLDLWSETRRREPRSSMRVADIFRLRCRTRRRLIASSRRPTFDGGRAAGMGTGSNAGSRCHGRPRLSNPGQPFS